MARVQKFPGRYGPLVASCILPKLPWFHSFFLFSCTLTGFVSAITQYDYSVFIPRLLSRQDCSIKGNISEEEPETNNTGVVRIGRECEQNVREVGGPENDLPQGKIRFHGPHCSDQQQNPMRFQFFPFEFHDGEQ